MPSAKSSAFKGGGGILRDQDGTIEDLVFTTERPGDGTKKPKSDFEGVYAKLTIRPDGSDAVVERSLLVGGADNFGITEDEHGLTGTEPIPRNLSWGIFYSTLVKPTGGGEGFDEDTLDDSDPDVADYTPVIGARARFNWQVNEATTKKLGKRPVMKDGKPVKGKDGKPLAYDREDLIVSHYYGQAEVAEAPLKKAAGGKVAAKPSAKTTAAPKGKSVKAAVLDIAEIAADAVIQVLTAAKDNTLLKSKLSVKLLSQLADQSAEVRSDVRAWVFKNLDSIEGVEYDAATEMVSLAQ